VTILQIAKESGRAIVSAIVNTSKICSLKLRELGGLALQLGWLGQYSEQQKKLHDRHREWRFFPMFYPPVGRHHYLEPKPERQLWPRVLAVGDSSTECNENQKVLLVRRGFCSGGGTDSTSGRPLSLGSGAGEIFALYFILRLNCYICLGLTALCVTSDLLTIKFSIVTY